jgi:hypothetical protein
MQIRIVIHTSPVKPNDRLVRVTKLCRQLPCLVGHHREQIEIGDREMALRCARCGWRSPGWKLGSPAGAAELKKTPAMRAPEILLQSHRSDAYAKSRSY